MTTADQLHLPPRDTIYTIHYACETFPDQLPRPWVVAIYDPVYDASFVFRGDQSSERDIRNQMNSMVRAFDTRMAISWNMGGASWFGWSALAKRALPTAIYKPFRHTDLADYLWRRFGDSYAAHGEFGRLHECASNNNVMDPSCLGGKREAELIAAGNLDAVVKSTIAKTKMICGIYTKLLDGNLVVGPFSKESHP
jgi:hypothetical protein